MVESLVKLQQLMAESRFVEAEKLAEVYLIDKKYDGVHELQLHYFEILIAQEKKIPDQLLIKFLNSKMDQDLDLVQKWIPYVDSNNKKFERSLLNLKILISEKQGLNQELFKLLQKFLVLQFENKQTDTPDHIENLITKYFPDDFNFKILELSNDFHAYNLEGIENKIKDLILSCFESSTQRGRIEKINKLNNVLINAGKVYHLEIYKIFCYLISEGIKSKKDIKKLIEVIIYFNEVKFQVIILWVLDQNKLNSVAQNYSGAISENNKFKFVYISKYHPNLIKYFSKRENERELLNKNERIDVDLNLQDKKQETIDLDVIGEISNEEKMIPYLVKLQNYESPQLLDLSVSLYQSEFYYASCEVAKIAFELENSNVQKLKATYLKTCSLLRLGDYRAVVDESLKALQICETQNDILSFLYSLSEAYLKLGDKAQAKKMLIEIVSIDEKYRLAKLKLDNLNAL